MKKLFENIAIFLVLVLSLFIVFLVVKYNMIDEKENKEEFIYKAAPVKKVSVKEKRSKYLQNLEGYNDIDIQVDAHKESMSNTVRIKSELHDDSIASTVDDHSKSSYMENLKEYSEKSEDEELEDIKPVDDTVGAPKKLEKEEVEDTIGIAIDALIDE